MTRDEAIEKLEELADESRALEHIDECCGLEQAIEIVKQIDEPKWHKVSEEGYPKEEGLYLTCIESGTHNLMLFKNGTFWSMCAVYPLKIVAWQRIKEFKQ